MKFDDWKMLIKNVSGVFWIFFTSNLRYFPVIFLVSGARKGVEILSKGFHNDVDIKLTTLEISLSSGKNGSNGKISIFDYVSGIMDPSVLATMDRDALKKQIENMKYQASMERWPLSKSIAA